MLHTKVDLIVTLGGDGTVLWVCIHFLLYFNCDAPLENVIWSLKLLFLIYFDIVIPSVSEVPICSLVMSVWSFILHTF
jgi:hypothetical protein